MTTMKQVVQATKGGSVELVDGPIPVPAATEVLVRTTATVISPGTERFVTQLAQSNLLAKAKARPDLVRQVIDKARKEGIANTLAAVRTRLESDIPLGYSGVGEIVELGSLVRGLRVGQIVATAGAGYANHAHYQAVPHTLVAPVPAGVPADHAAFATVASIALHGFRQADVAVGSKVVVVGLGLIGQLACRIAAAAGCDVAGVDVAPAAVARAVEHGALGLLESGEATTRAIVEWSRGRGADAVLITAGAHNDSSIIRSVPERCRDRAVVVAVGDVGLDLDRNAFYHHELELRLARSYGPGRYDPTYEEWGVDYPVGYVRWTEGRNLEAALDLMAGGRLPVADLVSHRFAIDRAPDAYATLDDRSAGVVGIVLDYPAGGVPRFERSSTSTTRPATAPAAGRLGVGVCGAGLFVRSTILPSLRAAGLDDIVHVSSASGTSAARLAERESIGRSSSGADDVITDPDVSIVVVATPHASHAALTVAALEAGKHVYVEKPLAIADDELAAVIAALDTNPVQLHVGFNRRWSPMVRSIAGTLADSGPRSVHYRINAGALPVGHWYADRREGGRLLGEVCHFIDTANALVDAEPTDITCTGPNDDAHDTYGILISYADGSHATIGYNADGSRSTPKEWCEVQGGGHTLLLDDYRTLTLDGTTVKVERGKGHTESLQAFATALRNGTDHDHRSALLTTRMGLLALSSLQRRCVEPV